MSASNAHLSGAEPVSPASAFGNLKEQPADALLALIGMYRADERPDKIDLGVGVYRDPDGITPIMRAIKQAEAIQHRAQTTKAYLGVEGDERFVALLEPIVMGPAATDRSCRTGIQTPGGTGALKVGADLIHAANPRASIWLGNPTWPNHAPIFASTGLHIAEYPFFDVGGQAILFEAMLDALARARQGDIVLLHGCCHNPTGAEFTATQWTQLVDLMAERRLIPFIDLAYQGLGRGPDADAHGLRLCQDRLPAVLLAYSCDKNFGLYRERVGALWVQVESPRQIELVRQNVVALARCTWSMPPDHGAALVRTVLQDEHLTGLWLDELDTMRTRINDLRRMLGASHPRLATVARQTGMFATLPVTPEQVKALRAKHGIYMAGSGRINVAGLREETIPIFAAALAPYL